MKKLRTVYLSLAMALAAVLATTPVVAQGKGKGPEKDRKEREEWVRRDRDDRRDDGGWKDEVRLERRPQGRRSGSFSEAHRAFHREHDRVCRERAARRPLDVRWQLQVRSECNAAHDRWHDRHEPRP